ncbi:hypothetical protein GCM10023194_46450 [Planotetraspora phitsanulokensis]|uniref:Uncharacterized protein n=1 Tax=Planotetraspora phitsanulokensis TaxID=575192 RepID=A0A8J3U1R0_9ACTN|nr:hypothetical protein [Planotetraspora phitsanulokensis]GII36744.1 hypothetical protein Pph01_17470 [Planotetraspora phitsanulokensis]
MTALEQGYRKLMAWYPKEHRARHEAEMITVLLAGAAPGQDRPTFRETFDLLRGGLSIRLRRAVAPGSRGHWHDAVGMAALIAPVALFLAGLIRPAGYAWRLSFDAALQTLPFALPYGLIVLLVCLRRRRAAVACAWAWTVLTTLITLQQHAGAFPEYGASWAVADVGMGALRAGVCAAMLTVAPSHGPAPLDTRRLLTWAVAVFATTVAGLQTSSASGSPLPVLVPVLVVATAAVKTLRSPVGRRAIVTLLPLVGVCFPPPGLGDLARLAALTVLSATVLTAATWLARTGETGERTRDAL